MASGATPEFRAEAVRVALAGGLARRHVAAGFGIGFSTLGRCIQQDRRTPEKPSALTGPERAVVALRKENRMLREERDVPKQGGSGKAPVRRFPDERHVIPVNRLCGIMGVSPRTGRPVFGQLWPPTHDRGTERTGP